MNHIIKDFSHLIGNLPGFSSKLVEAHLGLYAGYVKKLNEIEEKLKTADPKDSNYSYGTFSELKRREAVAFNGAYLHQLYFENLTTKPTIITPELTQQLTAAFGSYEAFLDNLKGSATSTPGWVVLTKNKIDGLLHTYLVYEHHVNIPVHNEIILALDCWEHAFALDYGTDKPTYVNSFIKAINWNVVTQRAK
ncbi:MAG: Fe-Mn family superoxide dismutase [Patescibacteria group bacterium]|jgi:Fe-Mn family superoxide dismutase